MKSIRIIVASAPQGGTDTIARIMGESLSQSLGQQVIVENRPGASGAIGATAAAKAAADGYTLLMSATASAVIVPLTMAKPPYQARDFAPVSLVALTDYVLVVHPSLSVRSVKSLVALGRARPGELAFASSGKLGISHLAGELLMQRTGVNFLHVPYKGGSPAVLANMSGEVGFLFGTLPTVLPHIRSGRLRAIAVASRKRSQHFAQLPTVAETLPGFEVSAWYGLQGPAGTLPHIVSQLNAEVVRAIGNERVIRAIVNVGLEPRASSPAEFADHIRRESALWGKVIQAVSIPKS